MLYLYVVKNDDGSFKIVRVITSPINQRGNSGITYGNITILDLETRKAEGFWTQEDVYVDQGEYMIFKEKLTDFNEDTAVVTNTYVYERMPIEEIKFDLKNRVDSKRDEKYYSQFVFENVSYFTDRDSRMNIIGAQAAILSDPSVVGEDFIWRSADDQNIPMTEDKFKEFALELFRHSNSIYQTAWMIKAAIDAASTYEEVRAAAVWGDEPL